MECLCVGVWFVRSESWGLISKGQQQLGTSSYFYPDGKLTQPLKTLGQRFSGSAHAAISELHQGQISTIQAGVFSLEFISRFSVTSKLSARSKAVLHETLRGTTQMENVGGERVEHILSSKHTGV